MTPPDPRPTRALIVCDGATVPAALDGQAWDVRERIAAAGADPDLTLVIDNLTAKVAGEVNPRVLDLVRIAAECFAADLAAVLEHLSSRSIILVGHSFERTCASALYQRPD